MIVQLFWLSLVILAAGILIPLITSGFDQRIFRQISLVCTGISSLLLAAVSLVILVTGEITSYTAYQFFPGFTLSFFFDRLAAVFLLIIAMVAGCVAIYSTEYIEYLAGAKRRNLLCAGTALFTLAMVLVVVSANTFSFVLFWELMAAGSFILVMYDYSLGETTKAGIFYFVMTQLSTLFVLLGIITLFVVTGSSAMVPVPDGSSPLVTLAFIALFIGFSIKAGIIPFHKWLPYAHPASPSPISALMSGVMLKIAVYGILRFLLNVFTPELWWGVLILLAGTISAVLGIIYALKEHDVKGMLAYSSIENIGIIFIGIGLSVIFTAYHLTDLATLSLLGALFHSLNHALFKSLLFLTSGSVVHATHTRDIEHMGGLVHRMPWTAVLFFIGAVAISALPPLNGFASEILIYVSFFSSVAVVADPLFKVLLFICLALFALTSALSAACFVKAYGSIFLALPRSPESAVAREVPLAMLIGPAILAAACILVGLFSFQLFSLVGFTLPVPDLLAIGLLLLLMTALAYVVLWFTASHKVRTSGTWGCGTYSQEPVTEYTGHGFSEPIVTIFSPIYMTKKTSTWTFFDRENCIFESGNAEIRLMKIFEEYLYLPVSHAATIAGVRIAKIQNGCLDTYLLYVFVTVITLIVILGWFA